MENRPIKYLNKRSKTAINVAKLLDDYNEKYSYSEKSLTAYLGLHFKQFKLLGEGGSRIVYKLNNSTVIKMICDGAVWGHTCNLNEFNTSLKYPKLTTKIHLHYHSHKLNVLVSQRAKMTYLEYLNSPSYKESKRILSRYKKLIKLFYDMAPYNAGFVGNKLVAIDLSESSKKNALATKARGISSGDRGYS